jgi:hypothetical protein
MSTNWFDKYKTRLNSSGLSEADAFKNSTLDMINDTFSNATNFAQIDIGGVITDVRIININSFSKELIFRPSIIRSRGQILTIDSEKWMISDFNKDIISPKAKILRINNIMKWKDYSGVIVEEPCVLASSTIAEANNLVGKGMKSNDLFYLPTGSFRTFVQYNNNSKNIKFEQRFVFGSGVYKLVAVDDYTYVENSVGYIALVFERSEIREADDIINRLADNSHLDVGTSADGGGWL